MVHAFSKQSAARVAEVYDERFCRMWEFYLAGAEMSFRYQDLMVFQIQLTTRVDSLPLTRDYMFDWERAQKANEQQDWREPKQAAG